MMLHQVLSAPLPLLILNQKMFTNVNKRPLNRKGTKTGYLKDRLATSNDKICPETCNCVKRGLEDLGTHRIYHSFLQKKSRRSAINPLIAGTIEYVMQ